ncbi:Coatomer subunit epsilon-1 [Zea mays]|uniref:rRNA biogenesis protein RRP36 n=1 Tax=Zea mays TaxID=4577 RepID=A0A3L6DXF1_MAIZE|nr:Coatomer subunit epsilon-1 [Zea mays]
MASPDLLFNLWNLFYLGAYQATINIDVPVLDADAAAERDAIAFRSYIALGSYQAYGDKHESAATEIEGGDTGSQKEVVLCTLSSKFISISDIILSHRLEGIQDLSLLMDLLTKKGLGKDTISYLMKTFLLKNNPSRQKGNDKQLKSHPPKNVESEILREHIKKEREAAKAGKRPYYLKKPELRERKLMNKYNELKEAGKLDAFMEKRRRKNASKDHRFMPYRRNGDA